MQREKINTLETYLNSGLTNILIENVKKEIFEDEIILNYDIPVEELNGHFEGINFEPPSWYKELIDNNKKILVINDINKLEYNEQTKFIEILKYKKISTFLLPNDLVVIVLINNLKENKINEEVYSLLAFV